jgi:hypothetical protein
MRLQRGERVDQDDHYGLAKRMDEFAHSLEFGMCDRQQGRGSLLALNRVSVRSPRSSSRIGPFSSLLIAYLLLALLLMAYRPALLVASHSLRRAAIVRNGSGRCLTARLPSTMVDLNNLDPFRSAGMAAHGSELNDHHFASWTASCANAAPHGAC